LPTPRDILAQNRGQAIDLVQRVGSGRARQILEKAERDLVQRLAAMKVTGNFSFENLRAALAQIREVLKGMRTGMEGVLVGGAEQAAEQAAQGTVDYLSRVDREFRGVGVQPLALDEAAMFEQARVGARASVLRRLASSGGTAPGTQFAPHPAKPGIIERYGIQTIQLFERELQTGMIARKSWDEMRGAIVGQSTFLQGKPAFWADRIVRTEMMGAYNRGSWEASREADDQLGDMIKILSATFDDRTGADSFAVHGQIRRTDEAFESWFGLYQHPPNRPNDREIVVPHRISWPIPPYLKWKEEGEIAARWAKEKRKGTPPPRPNMSTIPLDSFGKQKPPKVRETEARPKRPDVPPEE
jgi:hypothetical protein